MRSRLFAARGAFARVCAGIPALVPGRARTDGRIAGRAASPWPEGSIVRARFPRARGCFGAGSFLRRGSQPSRIPSVEYASLGRGSCRRSARELPPPRPMRSVAAILLISIIGGPVDTDSPCRARGERLAGGGSCAPLCACCGAGHRRPADGGCHDDFLPASQGGDQRVCGCVREGQALLMAWTAGRRTDLARDRGVVANLFPARSGARGAPSGVARRLPPAPGHGHPLLI